MLPAWLGLKAEPQPVSDNGKTTMTLKAFIEQFDKENAIVLLEGKRMVLDTDTDLLIQLGKTLATKTKHITFRSGNADGSDHYFSLGVSSVDKSRLQVITPYTGHRQKTNQAYETFALDEVNMANEPEVVFQSKSNKRMEKLVDQYVAGARDRFSIKAAYILRDTIKVIGTYEIKPATFGIFYDDLSNPKIGGTGHTMNVCDRNKVPIIDQTTWFKWLEG
ncbi:hypothetical protein G3O08_18835 [Cryomorpha ignava]|uniref:Uncharacterized protein n=1 Tax=Cryomorpha ignava TaxID=101383 RepID=A0A7K3WV37_9FLAO|nr:hypothetical protein [Cryomorpha ignava]NEN25553.1 hypothetical protein [Cryomorpha ignava]